MQAACTAATDFAKNRAQFGLPISEYEAIQFKLADMAMLIDALRFMVYHAAAHQDRMGTDPKAWSRLERASKTREAAIVKCLGSEWASQVIDESLQIHGGLGYIRGTPIERAYRDARISEIFEGTNEIQRVVISRDLLQRGLEPPTYRAAGAAPEPPGRSATRVARAEGPSGLRCVGARLGTRWSGAPCSGRAGRERRVMSSPSVTLLPGF